MAHQSVGDNLISRSLLAINQLLIRISRGLFSYQIFIEAETTPDVAFVLAHTVGQKGSPDTDLGLVQHSTPRTNRLTSGQQ